MNEHPNDHQILTTTQKRSSKNQKIKFFSLKKFHPHFVFFQFHYIVFSFLKLKIRQQKQYVTGVVELKQTGVLIICCVCEVLCFNVCVCVFVKMEERGTIPKGINNKSQNQINT